MKLAALIGARTEFVDYPFYFYKMLLLMMV